MMVAAEMPTMVAGVDTPTRGDPGGVLTVGLAKGLATPRASSMIIPDFQGRSKTLHLRRLR